MTIMNQLGRFEMTTNFVITGGASSVLSAMGFTPLKVTQKPSKNSIEFMGYSRFFEKGVHINQVPPKYDIHLKNGIFHQCVKRCKKAKKTA